MPLSSPTRSILKEKQEKKMSARQRLPEHSLLLFILLTSAWSPSEFKRNCSLYDFIDFNDNNIQGNDITFGDCSFEKTLCNYTQACTDGDANNWTVSDGGAVCPGRNGLYESFSVLMSPLLNVTQNTSLVFNYSQASPGRLSVFLATSTKITQVLPEEIKEVSDQQVVFYINSSLVKLGFKARMANNGSRVTLTHVKLQVDPVDVTVAGTLNTPDQSVTSSTTTGDPKPDQQGGSTSGIIAAVVVPVVVVGGGVAGVLVFFLWRRRKQRQNRAGKYEAEKGSQNIFRREEIRSVTPAGTSIAPQDKPPTNYGTCIYVISGTNSIQYNVPSNGLHVDHRLEGDKRCLPKFTSPTVSDNQQKNYNTLGEDIAMGTRGVCHYAKNKGVNSINANNVGKNYNRINTPGGKPSWEEERSSAVDDDYNYNHIISRDRDAVVRLRSGEHSKSSSNGSRYGDCDVSRDDDDDDSYRRLLRAANRQFCGFTDQREKTTEPYDHVTGEVHDDYNRIHQGDRNKVIGYDYDHFFLLRSQPMAVDVL